jgi:hypothetical protein
MLKRPPQHRVDAPIIFVHPSDGAWDHERVRDEQARMAELGEDPKRHPYAQYQGGWTRYDLGATATVLGQVVCVRDYLDESKQPTFWYLRRLNAAQWYEVQPVWLKAAAGREHPTHAYTKAFFMGLHRVENGPMLSMPGGHPSAQDFDLVWETGRAQDEPIELPLDIGCAVYTASMPLTESEGKH